MYYENCWTKKVFTVSSLQNTEQFVPYIVQLYILYTLRDWIMKCHCIIYLFQGDKKQTSVMSDNSFILWFKKNPCEL